MVFDQHVKSIIILLPIPMVDISRHIAIDGTLVLVSFVQELISIDLTQFLNRIQQPRPASLKSSCSISKAWVLE